VAQDDYYYEIQLTNKQLVFYFMAGASGLILSFLAGVMVGRGVEGGTLGAVETRPVSEERVVSEQTPAPPAASATPGPGDFSYPQRLESDKPAEGLEKKAAGTAAARSAASATPAPAPARSPAQAALPPVPTPRPTPATTAATPAPAPATTRSAGPLPKALASSAPGFAIQVGAFKDKASADSVVKSLKSRGFPAYVEAPAGHAGGLFTVRVGIYRDRADAEAVQGRLNDDKFKPYIIKQ
jgi:cell division septation protein DedD